MRIYTTREFANIIVGCKTIQDVTDVIDYVMINAVAIISAYGAAYYNGLVFTTQEKLRSVEKIKL